MREVGMLITKKGFSLTTIFGEPAMVNFPVEYAMEIQRKFPGLIRRMVHTHPAGCNWMSEEDRTTLKAWTMAFAPYPITMEVICQTGKDFFRRLYWYELEPLEKWLKGDKKNPREFKLLEADASDTKQPDWVKEILKFSYET
ncbi:MAG: hypothetical protein WC346_20025 [Methanogenium sp.]|jgi:hypothetical protein